MKRMKFRLITCVALVLVFVMCFEIPVSAAASYIDLSDYLYDSSVSGAYTVKQYYYHDSSIDGCEAYGYDTSMNTVGKISNSQSSVEYTASSALYQVYAFYHPLGDQNSVTPSYLLSAPFNSTNIDSFLVEFAPVIYCSVNKSISCRIYFVFYKDGSFVTNKSYQTNVNVSAGEYTPVSIQANLLDYISPSDFDSFYVYFGVVVKSVSSGLTLSISMSVPESAATELDPGVLMTSKEVKVQETPVFSSNLSSDTVTYLVGATPAALSVNASVSDGGVITYQWYKSASASAEGSLISGATGSSYIPDTTIESDAYYYCIATSTLDGEQKSRKSNIAHIMVVKKPEKPQIVSDLNDGAIIEYYQDRTAGDMQFGVIVTDGGQLSYQWYQKTSASADGTMISGATSSTYRPPTSSIGLTYYYCVATNSKGTYSESVTSGVVGIRVVSPPDPAKAPVITSDLPSDPITYTEGDAASPLRIGAASPDGGVLSYQWYEMVDGSGKALAGEIYPTFTPATSVPGEYVYYCVVTNTLEDTASSVTSTYATVIVEEDQTDTLLGSIMGGVSDIIDGILNLPQLIIDGIKGLFIPDTEAMAAYQDKWFSLLSSRFGAIYEAVVLIDEFGQAISEQTKQGIIAFPGLL